MNNSEGSQQADGQLHGHKLWGGRFTEPRDPMMERFNRSVNFDKRLWKADIEGSASYAKALHLAKVIDDQDLEALISGLETVKNEWKIGLFSIFETDEDIHAANERRLSELIGPIIGGKLHTGRSRNDQVTTDLRIWLREEIADIQLCLSALMGTLCDRAYDELGIIFPGYTHMQRAQPVRWSHYLMSLASVFKRDYEHLLEIDALTAVLPLGSGAIAGNPLNLERKHLAELLHFPMLTSNSMDAVSDRDFVARFLFWAALTGIHLSRFAEDLIIYSTKEFNFISLSEAYSTGSSLMPQKRNPDALELIRGKSGRLVGNSTGFLVTMKGLPSTYNKDLQEDKEALFDSVDQIGPMLKIAKGVIGSLTINPSACQAALSMEMLATDVAYYLVRKGVPFREAHHVSGRLVALAENKNCSLEKLSFHDFMKVDSRFERDLCDIWNFETSVEQYETAGGTSQNSVLEQIAQLRHFLENDLHSGRETWKN